MYTSGHCTLITASKLLLQIQLSLILNTALYFHLHVVWMQYLIEGIRTTYFIYESSVDLSDHVL
jgi:hypothetical protein